MLSFTLTDEQEAKMNAFIEKHNKDRKCSVNKVRKQARKHNTFSAPCGGWGQYSLEITFTAIANLASIKCECGKEEYLGEV